MLLLHPIFDSGDREKIMFSEYECKKCADDKRKDQERKCNGSLQLNKSPPILVSGKDEYSQIQKGP